MIKPTIAFSQNAVGMTSTSSQNSFLSPLWLTSFARGFAAPCSSMVKLIGFLLLVSPLLMTTGCSKTAKASRHAGRADKYFNAGQYSKAEIEYLVALQLGGMNPRIVSQLGNIYYEQGRFARAFAFLTNAVALSPTNLDLQIRVAEIYLADRSTAEVKIIANSVLDKRPSDPEASILLAESGNSKKDVDEAEARLHEITSRLGETAPLQVAAAIIKLRQGDFAGAESGFKKAVETDPKSAAAHQALGNLYALKGDLKAADPEIKAAADLSPARSARHLGYAEFKIRSGDLEEGKRLLAEFSKQVPDYVPAWLKQADIALAEKQYTNCASLLVQALSHDPGNIEATVLHGRLMMTQDEPAKAISDFERVIHTAPRSARAHFLLALAQLATGANTEALKNLNHSVALDPNLTDAVLLLAELNLQTGNASAAVASLKEFTKQRPNIYRARLLLAAAYVAVKDPDSAAAIYQGMMTDFANSPQVPYLLGTVFALQKKPADARLAFEKSLARATNYLPAVEQLVNLDLEAGKYSDALKRALAEIDKQPKVPQLQMVAAKIYMAEASSLVKTESDKNGPNTSRLSVTNVPAASTEAAKAEAALLKAIELDPGYKPAYLMLTQVYISSNRHRQALDRLAILASTNDVPALMQVGMIHEALKEYEPARDAYEKLLSVNSRATMALNNLAYLYSEHLGQLDKAYELADRARQLQPTNHFAADTLGWILFKKGEFSRADGLIEESARRFPDQPEIQFHLGMVRYMTGQELNAQAALQTAAAAASDFPGKDQIAKYLETLALDPAKLSDADIARLEKSAPTDPITHKPDPIALIRLAAAYERKAAFQKAASCYDQALKGNPENAVVMGRLAQLYADNLAEAHKARDLAGEAHRLAPDNPAISHLLGRLVFQQDGDFNWSLSLLQDAVHKLPDDPSVLYDFAWAAYNLGNVDESVAAMANALKRSLPPDRLADAKLFVELAPLEPADRLPSRDRVQLVLKNQPAYLPALMASAVIAEREGNKENAKSLYQKILLEHRQFSPAARSLALLDMTSFKDDPQAYSIAARAREAYPQDPAVAKALGIFAYLRGNDDARAIELLKEARKSSDDSELLYYLGMAHWRQKQPVPTRDALRRALDLNLADNLAANARQVLAELK
jgi:tetratricopeptide (TPR) repeat protein